MRTPDEKHGTSQTLRTFEIDSIKVLKSIKALLCDINLTGISQSQITNLVFDLASKQVNIQFQDESVLLGSPGTVNTLNFIGNGVTATRTGNVVNVDIPGGGSGPSLPIVHVYDAFNVFQFDAFYP